MSGPKSRRWYKRAQAVIPGGVSSPVRAFHGVGGNPIVFEHAQGAEFTDVDGNRYVDFVGSWGPLILGHADPDVVAAVQAATARGTSYGAPCTTEVELAETIIELYPGIEAVRFVSSGTEATMSAIRLARGVTGRDLIVKFAGCYHGHVDHLLVAAGSGLTTLGQPDSAGVPADLAALTRVLDLDDEPALAQLFAEEGERIAAVIIEPLPANHGLMPQRPEFLRTLRRLTHEHNALLIFDEVISGFRIDPAGAAGRYGITPDLATFGKVIGGGLPVGAFAGRNDVMQHLAPEGPVYQAGTLSGNPVAMAAGLTTLRVLQRTDGWARLQALGESLEQALSPVFEAADVPVQLVREGSVFWLCFQGGEAPRSARDFEPAAAARHRAAYHPILEARVYLAPSAFEVGFLSLAHRTEHIDRLAHALAGSLKQVAANV